MLELHSHSFTLPSSILTLNKKYEAEFSAFTIACISMAIKSLDHESMQLSANKNAAVIFAHSKGRNLLGKRDHTHFHKSLLILAFIYKLKEMSQ